MISTKHSIVLAFKFGESSVFVPEQVSEPVVNPAVLNFLPEKSRVFVERCPTSFALNFELIPDKIMTLTYPTRKWSISYQSWQNENKHTNQIDGFYLKFFTFGRLFYIWIVIINIYI